MTDLEPAEGCLRVQGEGLAEGMSKALCVLAVETALERKSRLGDIASFAHDGLANEQLASTCLTHIQRLAQPGDDEPMLGTVDRDEVVLAIVRLLDSKMTAEAEMHCENALAIARMLTEQGWLVVKSDGVL